MDTDSDGMAETIQGHVRVALTAAAQLAERAVRARAEAMRHAQAASEREARELQTRFDAERRAAQAELASVHQDGWWDRATPDQIGRAHQVAQAWSAEDPDARAAENRIRTEVQQRYGVVPDARGGDPEKVQTWITRYQEQEAAQRAAAQKATGEQVEAKALMNQAAAEERRADQAREASEHEPDPDDRAQAAADANQHETTAQSAYDSAERRAATATELRTAGIPDRNVETRMRADVSQARPATEAVTSTTSRKAPKARKSSTRVRQTQRGLDR